MRRQSSILDFFSSPKVAKPTKDTANAAASSTPARKPALTERITNQPEPSSSPSSSSLTSSSRKRKLDKNRTPSKQKSTVESNKSPKYQEFDLVWARLDGYPHWPALICSHPKSQEIFRQRGKQRLLHVQFFEENPKRSWIRESDCLPFVNAKHPKLEKVRDEELRDAIEMATEALAWERAQREALVIQFASSDDDDEFMEEDEEDKVEAKEAVSGKKDRENRQNVSQSSKKRVVRPADSDDSDDGLPQKKSRFPDSDSDVSLPSEDEYKPTKDAHVSSSESELSLAESEELSLASEPSDAEEFEEEVPVEAPVKKASRGGANLKNKKASGNRSKTVKLNQSVNNRSMNQSMNQSMRLDDDLTPSSSGAYLFEKKDWPHTKFEFLFPENIRDKNKNRPDHSAYDPTTLFVPNNFLKEQTAAHRQWWEIKSNHYDKIIFFKMGKFYELFHQDAVVAVNELDILYMRGEYAHAGFPEISFGRYSRKLIEKNYKLVRVEQTETPEGRAERQKGVKGGDKVVKREVCRVLSKGTRTLSAIDSDFGEAHSSYCLTLVEKVKGDFD